MALADFQFSYNGLLMGAGTSYKVREVEGLDLPEVRSSDDERPQDHGLFAGRDLLGGREVVVSLEMNASSNAALEALVAALRAATVPQEVELPLSFQLVGQGTRRVNCRPRRVRYAVDTRYALRAPKATVQFVATDPRIYDDALSSQAVGLPTAEGGRTFPTGFPLTFGVASTGGTIAALNAGNFPTRPVATITGPVDNPRIENVTAGKTIRLALSLLASDSLEVDFDAHAVTLNGTASRRSAMTPDSEWWELAPGTSTVRFAADTFVAGARLTLAHRSAWL